MGRKLKPESAAPDLERGVRSLIAESRNEEHISYRTLTDAKSDPDGVVIFEGDDGGQIYLVARASFVSCAESQLQRLLAELDALRWADPDSARVYYERLPVGSGVAGGMGGGRVAREVWIHAELKAHESAVRHVLQGKSTSIHQ